MTGKKISSYLNTKASTKNVEAFFLLPLKINRNFAKNIKMKKGNTLIPANQNDHYNSFVEEIVSMIQSHQIVAAKSVQGISNQLYWNMGELILAKQAEYGWGQSVIDNLSRDLMARFGEDSISYSKRNLQFMRQLVLEYSNVNQVGSHLESEIVKQPASHLKSQIVKQPASHLEVDIKQLVCQVPWWHNISILQKVKNPKARIFYLQTTIRNQYSRAVLEHQIKAKAYEEYLANPAQHNFDVALPEHMLEQARESIKSTYSLSFLEINKPMKERELERAMVENVKRLMLELGYGFCFIGNQHRLTLGEKEYFVDLLFYHRILKCLVAVELKVTDFEPEFVGKLDFYIQLIDEQLKQSDDNPTIGLLLVPSKDNLEVEYALKISQKPIGVSQYKLSKQLPKELQGKLPTAEDFKQILGRK